MFGPHEFGESGQGRILGWCAADEACQRDERRDSEPPAWPTRTRWMSDEQPHGSAIGIGAAAESDFFVTSPELVTVDLPPRRDRVGRGDWERRANFSGPGPGEADIIAMQRWQGGRSQVTRSAVALLFSVSCGGGPLPPFLTAIVLLVVLVAAGVGAIVAIRRAWLRSQDDRAEWERTLGDYKNLRDRGVLSEQEYRNIRTLVEPRTRLGVPADNGRRGPAVESDRPLHGRE